MARPKPPTSYTEIIAVLESLPCIVQAHRRLLGVSLREAARQSGINASAIHRCESGEGLQFDTAMALLRWIDGTELVRPNSEKIESLTRLEETIDSAVPGYTPIPLIPPYLSREQWDRARAEMDADQLKEMMGVEDAPVRMVRPIGEGEHPNPGGLY